MAAQRVADMTREDLRAFVEEVVERRLQAVLKPRDTRTVKEINDSIRRNRWTPPRATPSTPKLLREDRDR